MLQDVNIKTHMQKCNYCPKTCEELGYHSLFFQDDDMFCEECAPKAGIEGNVWEAEPTVGVHCCKDCGDDCTDSGDHDDEEDNEDE
jgi:hypothetical protein